MAGKKARILILADWFAPGYKAGGPIRSCVNFAYAMRDEYDIYVISSIRDFGEADPYTGIIPNTWHEFDLGIQIQYRDLMQKKGGQFVNIIQEIQPDYVYLNSMFSWPFTILPLLWRRLKGLGGKWILAPRGMLHAGALQFKSLKKRSFLFLLKWLGLLKGINFHATDEQERKDIQGFFGAKSPLKIIGNWPAPQRWDWESIPKKARSAKMVFISRISPKKNLGFFLELLPEIKDPLQLDIYGPIEDEAYWKGCQQKIEKLQSHIRVQYKGVVAHTDIARILRHFHAFVLPTWGENFGHAIFEAMQAGKPVLISDQSPWRNLYARKMGWDLPLTDREAFVQAVRTLQAMDQPTYDIWSQNAWKFAKAYPESSGLVKKYHQLFSQNGHSSQTS